MAHLKDYLVPPRHLLQTRKIGVERSLISRHNLSLSYKISFDSSRVFRIECGFRNLAGQLRTIRVK